MAAVAVAAAEVVAEATASVEATEALRCVSTLSMPFQEFNVLVHIVLVYGNGLGCLQNMTYCESPE